MFKLYSFYDYEKLTNSQIQNILLTIPSDRIHKANQYKNRIDYLNCLLSYHLLIEGLKEWGYNEQPVFFYSPKGKPYLKNIPLYFNISHCKKGCVCVISEHPIGVDIQDMRIITEHLINRVCCKEEINYLLPLENKNKEFIKIWAKKESISKLSGDGLSVDFREINTLSTSNCSIYYENEEVIVAIAQ